MVRTRFISRQSILAISVALALDISPVQAANEDGRFPSLDDGALVPYRDLDNKVKTLYVEEHNVEKALEPALVQNGRVLDIQSDHLGSPGAIVDRVRDKAIWSWSVIADAFGDEGPNEDPDGDSVAYIFDMRFPGQRYDSSTNLFQNWFRDYDPSSGRYVQSDPLGLSAGM